MSSTDSSFAPKRPAFGYAAAALWVVVATSCVPSPAQAQDDWWGRDKALHYGASVVITAGGHGLSALWLDEPWQRAVAGASLGLGAGIAKEFHDLAGYGDPSWKDLTWDIAGVATGVGLSLLVEVLVAAEDGGTAVGAPPATLTLRF